MAIERGQKISFQENLEAIKERMKEKRNQNQTKVNRGKQILTSKMKNKVLSKSSFIKNIQTNNHNLALSLEAEKKKLRQAYDVILSLKRERQVMMFYILMLKRKLEEHFPEQFERLKLVSDSIGEDLSNLGDDLPQCIPSCSSPVELFNQDAEMQASLENSRIHSPENTEITTAEASRTLLSNMMETQPSLKSISRGRSQDSAHLVAPLDDALFERMDTVPAGVSIRRQSGRRSSSFHAQISAFNLFTTFENCTEVPSTSEEHKFDTNVKPFENVPNSLDCSQGTEIESTEPNQVQMSDNWDSEKVETKFASSVRNTEVVNSKHSESISELEQEVEQRGRRRKVMERNKSTSLSKHVKQVRTRARSKSRDGSQSNGSAGKERKMILDCSDTYNFDYEESIHLTPFRRKPEPNSSENVNSTKSSIGSESNSDDDLDDSLYLPPADKRLKKSWSACKAKSETPTAVITRPSQRTVILRKDSTLKKESGVEIKQNEIAQSNLLKTSEYDKINLLEHSQTAAQHFQFQTESDNEPESPSIKHKNIENFQNSEESNTVEYLKPVLKKCMLLQQEESAGKNATMKNKDKFKTPRKNFKPRFSLCDVTNFSKLPSENKEKKMSCPALLERMNTISPIVRKRRCTMTVNYKEPSLLVKLRRGDRYTDTQFLNSPIFKQRKNNACIRKSGEKSFPLSRYNEAFVGCR
ncbi:shugoshin 1-like isoform X1 [Hemiscyllium ocellatum]|uniref:shugoshin 1-like isoform X1 n=1 Tax=Hemiscyllium ocellatum TaxID=170820 RepID=UPI002966D946|nr:shugoshin 1-like isoform X1 [Hemiscyllium ocellatum]XP_060680889.1 shugoshin 1-like isoform X1 [Hemiscyllium ocellatum]XP_060680890.1 shugoshin 1-like isoform X1 [Hemiscyllium ocellatum]XP_060680891.1 shugoshin 1-like isoform X1 [Hemiscyllium ocellatum]XP_060680892.1 shugoshin 1-like isoform X1 [Hemiscyllium ocellatum]XP_060680893.1 shugoshin 1-like isoform X1 [Hemiscyllium ocellatum]XP_060680894.1 shugoshin 1-like isoform X1 [Hemiscyllium ocellatum]